VGEVAAEIQAGVEAQVAVEDQVAVVNARLSVDPVADPATYHPKRAVILASNTASSC